MIQKSNHFCILERKGPLVIKSLVRPLTSLAKISTSPIPKTFVLPPSGLVTVVPISLILLNQFLFTTMWSVLPESRTKSCSVASLDALSDFSPETKLPGLVTGGFFHASLN